MNRNSRFGHEFSERYEDDVKEYHNQLGRDEMMKRSEQKNLVSYIQKMVNVAKAAREDDLEAKRERLRELLEIEEAEYKLEFIAKMRGRAEQNVREREESLLALKKNIEKQRDEFVKQKRIQQYMTNSDDIRPVLRQNLLKESKVCQLAQIEEKRQIKLKEKEHEALWVKVRKCIEEAEKQRIRDEQYKRYLRNQDDRKELDRQMQAIKEARDLERKEAYEHRMQLEAELRTELEHEKLLKEQGLAKREKDRESLKSALDEGIRLKKLKEANELYYEKLYADAIKIQMAKEEQELKAKVNTLREATLRYLDYCNQVKKERAEEEKKLNDTLASFSRRVDEEKVRRWQQEAAKKAETAQKCHNALLEQIRQNAERNIKQQHEEYQRAIEDQQRIDQELRIVRENEIRRERAALDYGRELLNQVDTMKKYQDEQRKLFNEDLRKAKEEEDFRLRLAEKFIQENIDYLPAHPNWKLMTCPCLNK